MDRIYRILGRTDRILDRTNRILDCTYNILDQNCILTPYIILSTIQPPHTYMRLHIRPYRPHFKTLLLTN
jgi:hypothetical protein